MLSQKNYRRALCDGGYRYDNLTIHWFSTGPDYRDLLILLQLPIQTIAWRHHALSTFERCIHIISHIGPIPLERHRHLPQILWYKWLLERTHIEWGTVGLVLLLQVVAEVLGYASSVIGRGHYGKAVRGEVKGEGELRVWEGGWGEAV